MGIHQYPLTKVMKRERDDGLFLITYSAIEGHAGFQASRRHGEVIVKNVRKNTPAAEAGVHNHDMPWAPPAVKYVIGCRCRSCSYTPCVFYSFRWLFFGFRAVSTCRV